MKLILQLLFVIFFASSATAQQLGCWKETGKTECANLGVNCLLNPEELKYNYQYFGNTVGDLCDKVAIYAATNTYYFKVVEKLRDDIEREKRKSKRLERFLDKIKKGNKL